MHPDSFGPAPALVAPASRPLGTILLLHGQFADALANVKELALLQGAGFHAVGIDAPEHGRRYAQDREARWDADGQGALASHIETAAREIPAILDGLEEAGFEGPFGVVGISLGAFTAWRALPLDPRLRLACPVLGSPVLPWEDAVPDPAGFEGRRIFAINAEQDESVPIGPTQQLVAALPDARLQLLAQSPHRVPEDQWWASWGAVIRFLLTER